MAADDPRDELREFLGPAWGTDFYQTVKLVEYLARRLRTDDRPVETPASGEDPELEPIRFQSHASLGFAPSDMSRIELAPEDRGLPTLRVDFMGLAGVRGPLPLFYTQLIRDRVRLGDTGLRDFIDTSTTASSRSCGASSRSTAPRCTRARPTSTTTPGT
ncbi:MAG: type VI secretion system baseplate subunit TssG [bacterium]